MSLYSQQLYTRSMESPAGKLYLTADNYQLYRCSFNPPEDNLPALDSVILDRACSQLEEYFAGTRKGFDLQLSLDASAFYLKVWLLLRQIDYGHTCTYSELADLLGVRNGARAAGRAVGANPLLIIIPCHRVLGENGTLTGYAGGKERKRFLLQHELQHGGGKERNLLF